MSSGCLHQIQKNRSNLLIAFRYILQNVLTIPKGVFIRKEIGFCFAMFLFACADLPLPYL